jgi:hypothetical protein
MMTNTFYQSEDIYYKYLYKLLLDAINVLQTNTEKCIYNFQIYAFNKIDNFSIHTLHYGYQNGKYWTNRIDMWKPFNKIPVFRKIQLLAKEMGYCLVDWTGLAKPKLDIRLYSIIPPYKTTWHNYNKVPNIKNMTFYMDPYSDECKNECCNKILVDKYYSFESSHRFPGLTEHFSSMSLEQRMIDSLCSHESRPSHYTSKKEYLNPNNTQYSQLNIDNPSLENNDKGISKIDDDEEIIPKYILTDREILEAELVNVHELVSHTLRATINKELYKSDNKLETILLDDTISKSNESLNNVSNDNDDGFIHINDS